MRQPIRSIGVDPIIFALTDGRNQVREFLRSVSYVNNRRQRCTNPKCSWHNKQKEIVNDVV